MGVSEEGRRESSAGDELKSAAFGDVKRLRESPTGFFFGSRDGHRRNTGGLENLVSQSMTGWRAWHRDQKRLRKLARDDPKDVGEYLFTLYGAGADLCVLQWARNPTVEVFFYEFRYRHISAKMVAAMSPHKPRSTKRYEAICDAYFETSLFIEPFALGLIQGDKELPPGLRQAALADLAAYVGVFLNTEEYPSLKRALTEEGGNSPQARRSILVSRLPVATLLAWDEVLENGYPLTPGDRKKNLVSRTANYVLKDGRESLTKTRLVDEPFREEIGEDPGYDHSNLSAEDVELQEFVRQEELRAVLPEREYQVIAMRLQDYTLPEIARELKIAPGNAKKTMHRARAKLRGFREASTR